MSRLPPPFLRLRTRCAVLAAFWIALLPALPAAAQPASRPVPAAAEAGVRWGELSASQRNSLRPLEREWPRIDADQKQKWIEVAGRFPAMPAAEQERVQARMAAWTRLSPAERGQARLNYQAATQLSAEDRRARWQAYQDLPADQRRQLAARAVPAAPTAAPRPPAPQAKSNIVPNPAFAAAPRAVAPSVVQAKPGATTNLMSTKPVPPSHQQTGLPKIAATQGFVDPSTLLPQRGPQGAAVRPVPPAPPKDNKRP